MTRERRRKKKKTVVETVSMADEGKGKEARVSLA